MPIEVQHVDPERGDAGYVLVDADEVGPVRCPHCRQRITSGPTPIGQVLRQLAREGLPE